uniref:Divalent-cation tolerance protein CutA n=1 Tax=Parastrongyloides trichosuri TaxID=131310 RepID=A0A0N4ZJW3_PARTI
MVKRTLFVFVLAFLVVSRMNSRVANVFSVIYVTVPKMEVAKTIARNVVESKLAACVNIIPGVTSVYSWKGNIEEDQELLLIIKTKTNLLEELKKEIVKIHPYEVPEFISLPIEHGSEPYLKWIGEQTKNLEST